MSIATCPRCAHEIPERQRGEPDCPACGVIFAKFDPDRAPIARMQSVTAARPARPPVILIGLLAAIAVTLVVMLSVRQQMRVDLAAGPTADAEPEVSKGTAPEAVADADAAPSRGLTARELRDSSDLDEYGERDPDRERSSIPASQLAEMRAAVESEARFDLGAGDEPIPADLRVVTDIDGVDDLQWVGWYSGVDGYERGLEQARSMNRPLVVYFHTDWCNYCRAMNKDFLPDPLVRRFLSNVLRVHLNPESSAEAQALATVFGVAGYPSFFVLPAGDGPSGAKRVHPFRNGVAITPQEFAAECEEAAKAG